MRGVAVAVGDGAHPVRRQRRSRRPAWPGPSRSQITSREGGRSGSTTTDELDESALREAVARSEALLAAARPDPEQVEGLGPQDYPPIPAFDEATAAAGPIERRDGVKPALELSRGLGLAASGFFENTARWAAIANKKGNFGFHRSTSADYSTTMRTADGTGSGYASFSSPRLSDIDASRLAERAAKKAETSAQPRDLPPGRYTVILEPAAVADLLGFMSFSLNARAADEGRSFLSKPGGGNRLGEKLFADGVTLRSDPFDRAHPGSPWSGGGGRGLGFGFGGGGGAGGLPARRTTWIENGVVKTLVVDRYWAAKTKVEPVPLSGGLQLEGSDKSLEDLIAETERALLVTRFWYIRSVNPRERHRHRADPRRRLAGREGEGRPPGEQLPVQRQPGEPAQEPRGDQRRGSGRRQ